MSAFREIVEQYKRMVYHLALDMTGSPHDADDVSQDVFLRVYRSLESFRGDAKVSSWLYRIAINVCLDRRSKKATMMMELREDMESGEHGMTSDNNATHPVTATESRMIQQHIDIALRRLTPRERSVFVLRHYNDLSMKEIATTLSVTVGTVKSTLFHAIEKLQKELSFYKKDFGLGER
jgi:RNA polymerase sigma-70 factor (ECF subfamily)